MRLLTAEELEQLTDYVRPGKQCEALLAMGIPYVRSPRTGRPKVLYEDVHGPGSGRKNSRKAEPKWDQAS